MKVDQCLECGNIQNFDFQFCQKCGAEMNNNLPNKELIIKDKKFQGSLKQLILIYSIGFILKIIALGYILQSSPVGVIDENTRFYTNTYSIVLLVLIVVDILLIVALLEKKKFALTLIVASQIILIPVSLILGNPFYIVYACIVLFSANKASNDTVFLSIGDDNQANISQDSEDGIIVHKINMDDSKETKIISEKNVVGNLEYTYTGVILQSLNQSLKDQPFVPTNESGNENGVDNESSSNLQNTDLSSKDYAMEKLKLMKIIVVSCILFGVFFLILLTYLWVVKPMLKDSEFNKCIKDKPYNLSMCKNLL